MSDISEYEAVDVEIRNWVESVRANPPLYRDRQVTEIVLTAIGLSPTLNTNLILKGGTVMALAFKSQRTTGDVDFTSIIEPAEFTERTLDELNTLLPRAAVKLGYIDILCRVQTVKKLPRPLNFEDHDFPALLIRIGSAKRGTNEQSKLEQGRASRVLDMEISFRDQVYTFRELNLTGANVAVRAFTFHELIAEKMRALIQQPIRNRYRRQDVYDIAYLIEGIAINKDDKSIILDTLIKKCKTRGINIRHDSMNAPEIKQRAESDWHTLELELGDLPKFEEKFSILLDLYNDLPWHTVC